MTTFLNCNAKLKFSLVLTCKYQSADGVVDKDIIITPNTTYKISVADNEYGLVTYIGKIIDYTISNEKADSANLTKKYNDNLKVDTIKIDCSNKEESCVRTINISDIRFIDSYSTSGFQELERDIKTFK